MFYTVRAILIVIISLTVKAVIPVQNLPPTCTCTYIPRPNALEFSCNDFTKVPSIYRLPNSTTHLIISGEQMSPTKLVQLLQDMTILQDLSLRHLPDLSTILNGTFRYLGNLSSLELLDMPRLSLIQTATFSNLINLGTLIIRLCKRLGVQGATDGLKSLKSPNLQTLVLDDLQHTSDWSPFESLKEGLFKTLGHFPLRKLVFTRNNVVPLYPGFSSHVRNLTCLILQANNAKALKRGIVLDIVKLEHLRFFDVSYQYRQRVVDYYPSLNETCLEPFSEETEATNVERNILERTEDLMKSMCRKKFQLPKQLRFAFLNDVYAATKKIDVAACVYPNNNVRYIDMSENSFDVNGPVIGLVRLMYLRAQFCQLSSLLYHSFAHFPSLRYLLIGGNNMKHSFRTGNATSALTSLSKLESLDLASCQIDHLSSMDAGNILQFPKVNLSHNFLAEDNVLVQSHTQMKFSFLNLSFNTIRSLPRGFRESFDILSHNEPGALIDLTGNPLVCGCETLEFLIWIEGQSDHFMGFDDYICSFNTKGEYLKNITRNLGRLSDDCHSGIHPGIAAIVSVVAVLLLSALILVGYKRRRQLQYGWFRLFLILKTAKMRVKNYKPFSNEDDYRYDTFVIYSHKDREWVIDQLRPALESTGVCLCIGERDFDLGVAIADAVAWSLSNSRCVVLVLSSNLLGSTWCEYEVTMALILSQKVIVVCLEDVPYRRLPAAVYYLIKTRTRLMYKEDQERQNEFWSKLVRAVKPRDLAI